MRFASFALLCAIVAGTVFGATPEQLQRAQEAFERINLYRRVHGLSPVTLDTGFVDACVAHANYLDLNSKNGVNPYDEDSSLPGFTSAGKAVAPDIILTYQFTGAAAVTDLFRDYGTRGFLLASDFTKAGYGDSPGATSGFPIAVIRIGHTHSPEALLSPPNGSIGNAASGAVASTTEFGAQLGNSIILYGAGATSNLAIVSSSISAGGSPIAHTGKTQTTSGSRPTILKDLILQPSAALPVNSLITVVVDYTENGAAKHTEWSFSTSANGLFDPAAFGTSQTPFPGGGSAADTSDADDDGFPANVEVAANTLPGDATSTPFNNLPAGTAQSLTLLKGSIKLNLAKPLKDSIAFNGTLPVRADFTIANAPVIVDVGGVARAFVLSDKGKAKNEINSVNSFKLSKPKLGTAKYTVKLSKGSFGADLADDGLVNDTVETQVSVPMAVYFDNAVYAAVLVRTYKAKIKKSGKTK